MTVMKQEGKIKIREKKDEKNAFSPTELKKRVS